MSESNDNEIRMAKIVEFTRLIVKLGTRYGIEGRDIIITLRALMFMVEEINRQPNIDEDFLGLAVSDYVLGEIKRDNPDSQPDQRRH